MATITSEELKAKLTEDKNFLNLSESERINILMQEVARLHKEIVQIHTSNQATIKQMLSLVDATQKGFNIINTELTRIAKLP